MNLGENIKKLRKDKNLSQEQLAEMINVSRQAISKWESNKACPDMENLILLREIFNVTLDDLVITKNNTESKTIEESDDLKKDIKWSDIKLDGDDTETEDYEFNLMIGGFMIGVAIGMITGNLMWSSAGCFIGMGVGYILESIKRKNKNLKID